MMYTLKDEIHVIILLIVYGIYLSSYLEILNILLQSIKKKVYKIIVEITLSLLEIYVAYIFVYKVQDGYIPIYFLLFIILGIIIYLSFRHQTLKVFNHLVINIVKIIKKTFTIFKEVIYPKYLKEINNTFKKRRTNKKNKDIITEKE